MATEEIKYFNVKNTSIRLVHIGGVMIAPEQIVPLMDDEAGINRESVEQSEYLEATDEESTVTDVEEKVKPKGKITAKSNTPTGAGWSDKK